MTDPALDMDFDGPAVQAAMKEHACEMQSSKTGLTPTTHIESGSRRAKSGGGRPAKGNYRLADGTKVPSCTTITKRFAPSEGLIHWAWRQGNEGKELNEARDKAAEIGANVHDAIEKFFGGTHEEECRAHLESTSANDEDRILALRSWSGFVRWTYAAPMQVLATETPMVSEKWRFGGTVDAVARVGGRLAVVDWKTGKGAVYPEHIVQMVAYGKLWEETRGEKIEEFHCLRPSKATGGFNHFYLPAEATEIAWQHFCHLRRAYETDAKVKALLG